MAPFGSYKGDRSSRAQTLGRSSNAAPPTRQNLCAEALVKPIAAVPRGKDDGFRHSASKTRVSALKDSRNNNCFTFRITLHAKTIDTKTIAS